jgi:methylated-DNA-[protein]-cysteine S-methyltransferase
MSAPPPLGLLFVARTERGLRYTEFMDRKSIRRVIASHEVDTPGATWTASLLELKSVVDQFEAYFCGALGEFNLPLDPVGSEFQLAAWNALLKIPFGQTRTYGEIAKAIGQPKAARAVGLANNQNPIVIIIPCHRVIGADGSLTGYGGGLPRKRWLLQHELRFARELGTAATRPMVDRPASAAVAVAKSAPQGARRKLVVAKAPPPARRATTTTRTGARPAARPTAVAARAGSRTAGRGTR